MLLQLRLLLKLLRKAVADSVDAADATEYHHQHHHYYKLVCIVIITLSCLLKVTKTTDDKFNSLWFYTKLIKSLLYSSEKSKICAVFVTFTVFDRLSVANFPSDIPDRTIREFIRQCPSYQAMSQLRIPIITRWFTCASYYPYEVIHLDHIGPFLLLVYAFSRWVELFPTKTTNALESASCMIQHFGRFGTLRSFTQTVVQPFTTSWSLSYYVSQARSNHSRRLTPRRRTPKSNAPTRKCYDISTHYCLMHVFMTSGRTRNYPWCSILWTQWRRPLQESLQLSSTGSSQSLDRETTHTHHGSSGRRSSQRTQVATENLSQDFPEFSQHKVGFPWVFNGWNPTYHRRLHFVSLPITTIMHSRTYYHHSYILIIHRVWCTILRPSSTYW